MDLHPFAALYPKKEKVKAHSTFFKEVKYAFSDFRMQDFFVKQGTEALYIQEIQMASKSYKGVIGCIDIVDFLNGHIKKHENIIADKEEKQISLLTHRSAIVKPILFTHPEIESLSKWIDQFMTVQPPFLELEIGRHEVHRLWSITELEKIQELRSIFQERMTSLYIADGHHRTSASAALYSKATDSTLKNRYRYLPGAFFAFNQLTVLDFNRVVSLTNDDLNVLFEVVDQVCDWVELPGQRKPNVEHEMTMYCNQKWYALKWKDRMLNGQSRMLDTLGVVLLNQYIIEPLLQKDYIQTIEYIEGPEGLNGVASQVQDTQNGVGFCLPPIRLEAIQRIADQEEVLPPKSTWFEPRLKNGMIIKELE